MAGQQRRQVALKRGAARPGWGRCRRRGFTLVELLVALGIIALLISMLLPVVNRARESSRRAVCLSNIAQLTKATIMYAGDNRDTLPDAGTGNSPDAPMSPRAIGLPAWTKFGPDTYVLPSIGQLLEPYVGRSPGVWQCPAGIQDFGWGGTDPLSGQANTDLFKPNFRYTAAKESVPALASMGANATKFKVPDWAVRNVSGMKIGRLRAAAAEAQCNVVLFYDRSPSYHARRKGDIYANETADYFASYGYLDGHADGRGYANWTQYLQVFHAPIPQTWWGQDFTVLFADEYSEWMGPPLASRPGGY